MISVLRLRCLSSSTKQRLTNTVINTFEYVFFRCVSDPYRKLFQTVFGLWKKDPLRRPQCRSSMRGCTQTQKTKTIRKTNQFHLLAFFSSSLSCKKLNEVHWFTNDCIAWVMLKYFTSKVNIKRTNEWCKRIDIPFNLSILGCKYSNIIISICNFSQIDRLMSAK